MTNRLTPGEVSAKIRISVPTLANWRCRGIGPPFVRFGGRILYPEDGLNQWIQRNTYGKTSQYGAPPPTETNRLHAA